MAHGVDPAVKGVEPAGLNPLRHRVTSKAHRRQLRRRDHSVLPPSNGRDQSIDPGWTTFVDSCSTFVSHPLIVARIVCQISARLCLFRADFDDSGVWLS